MKMIKKIIIILSFLLLFSCGYEPIYSQKSIKKNDYFTIQKIVFLNKKNINKIIFNKLKNYINLEENKKNYILNIDIIENKTVISKNKQGNPEVFSMKILLNLNVHEKDILKSKINFEETFDYNNQSNKFNLLQYENNIKNNLLNKISADIIKHLYTL